MLQHSNMIAVALPENGSSHISHPFFLVRYCSIIIDKSYPSANLVAVFIYAFPGVETVSVRNNI